MKKLIIIIICIILCISIILGISFFLTYKTNSKVLNLAAKEFNNNTWKVEKKVDGSKYNITNSKNPKGFLIKEESGQYLYAEINSETDKIEFTAEKAILDDCK